MCFELDSRPPVPAIKGAAVSHDELVLVERRDSFRGVRGTPGRVERRRRRPPPGRPRAVPVLRGAGSSLRGTRLHDGRDRLLRPHGRRGPAQRRLRVPRARPADAGGGIQADVAAAVAWLRESGCRAIFTVGFCFGGRNSWLAAAGGHRLAGAVGFYGNPGERDGRPGPTQLADRIDAPILALQAGDDAGITAELNAAFDRALAEAGVEHEVVTYDGAPHSFFDRKQDEFADACEDAWGRVLAFIERHS